MTELPPPKPAGWYPDPSLEGRLRHWTGGQWSEHVSDGREQYTEPYLGTTEVRWQFGIVNLGMFNSVERMNVALGTAGSEGWQLVTVYDKASNWFANMEKGFMLFRRPVPAGVRLPDAEWCRVIQF